MTEASVSFAANLTDDPERGTPRVGSPGRCSGWRCRAGGTQEASFFTVIVGRLQQRSWTVEDGSAHSTVEVVAEELGPSLRWATATRTTRS